MDGIDFQKKKKSVKGITFLGGGLRKICIIICCRLDSPYICSSIYTKVWEVVSNRKSIDGIDFQKNLSKGSLLWEGDLVKLVS
jgi:hypothetical protein